MNKRFSRTKLNLNSILKNTSEDEKIKFLDSLIRHLKDDITISEKIQKYLSYKNFKRLENQEGYFEKTFQNSRNRRYYYIKINTHLFKYLIHESDTEEVIKNGGVYYDIFTFKFFLYMVRELKADIYKIIRNDNTLKEFIFSAFKHFINKEDYIYEHKRC